MLKFMLKTNKNNKKQILPLCKIPFSSFRPQAGDQKPETAIYASQAIPGLDISLYLSVLVIEACIADWYGHSNSS